MRNLKKLPEPPILQAKNDDWLTAYKADISSQHKKTKYRCKDIKETLLKETGKKCIYCESKVGHNTPGDVEHKIPTSKVIDLHFTWNNLTIACTECNRRKNDHYTPDSNFLDPYHDDVESKVIHHGPIASWKTGDKQAEISVKILEISDNKRPDLILRKIERITTLKTLIERHENEQDPTLKGLLHKQILEMTSLDAEYSAMVISILKHSGVQI